MKKTPKWLQITVNVLVWLFVAFAVLTTILAFAAQSNEDGVPAIGGTCFLSVLTDSMQPEFSAGDLLLSDTLTSEEKRELNVGDVITFSGILSGTDVESLISHRIIAVNKNADGYVVSYTAKGDNDYGEQTVTPDDVVAVWSGKKIGGIGAFLTFLQQPKGFLIVIVLPLVLFFLYEVYAFVKTVLSVKNEGKKQITAADEELIKQKAIEEYLRQQAEAEAKKKEEAESTSSDSENQADQQS